MLLIQGTKIPQQKWMLLFLQTKTPKKMDVAIPAN